MAGRAKTTTIAVALTVGFLWLPPAADAAGPSSDFGRAACHYLKAKAMTAKTKERRKSLMAEYKRCLKEKGEG
ncbi:MAG: hypothetical protein ACR2OM_05435 [Aestuariivirgaceae bacterium]